MTDPNIPMKLLRFFMIGDITLSQAGRLNQGSPRQSLIDIRKDGYSVSRGDSKQHIQVVSRIDNSVDKAHAQVVGKCSSDLKTQSVPDVPAVNWSPCSRLVVCRASLSAYPLSWPSCGCQIRFGTNEV